MVIGFRVDGDFETSLHHRFEVFDIFEAVGCNKGVVHMYPYVNSTVTGDDFDEEAKVGDSSRESILGEMFTISVIVSPSGVRLPVHEPLNPICLIWIQVESKSDSLG